MGFAHRWTSISTDTYDVGWKKMRKNIVIIHYDGVMEFESIIENECQLYVYIYVLFIIQ